MICPWAVLFSSSAEFGVNRVGDRMACCSTAWGRFLYPGLNGCYHRSIRTFGLWDGGFVARSKVIKLLIGLLMLVMVGAVVVGCASDGMPTPTSSVATTVFPMTTQAPPPTVSANTTAFPTPTQAPPSTPKPTPLPTEEPIEHKVFRLDTPPTLDWQIVDSQTIVVATLITATAGTEATKVTPARYRPAHVLQFRAGQYLKGSGPNQFTVMVVDRTNEGPTFSAQSDALAEANRTLATRNTRWDSRPGVLFLEGPETSASGGARGTSGTTSTFSLTNNDALAQSPFLYSIDTLSRSWLPDASSNDSGTSRTTETPQEFITDGASNPPPVTSLTALQTRINEIQAMLDAGDDSEAFVNCVASVLKNPWFNQDWEPGQIRTGTLESGMPSGSEFGSRKVPSDTRYRTSWKFTARDDTARHFAIHPIEPQLGERGYTNSYRSTRPLIAGTYELRKHAVFKFHEPCNFESTHNTPGYVPFVVTVTAPTGTLHEAFFDPVTVGTTVKADGSNGVLKPTSFTVGSTATELTSLEWSNNKVVLTLGTHVSLSGYVLEFIELDGSVSLSLNVEDAMVDSTAGTYSWPMTSQPWADGDKLMVRIREG